MLSTNVHELHESNGRLRFRASTLSCTYSARARTEDQVIGERATACVWQVSDSRSRSGSSATGITKGSSRRRWPALPRSLLDAALCPNHTALCSQNAAAAAAPAPAAASALQPLLRTCPEVVAVNA